MNSGIITYLAEGVVDWWPTERLRWVIRSIPLNENSAMPEKVLQQLWENGAGQKKWRDIELTHDANDQ